MHSQAGTARLYILFHPGCRHDRVLHKEHQTPCAPNLTMPYLYCAPHTPVGPVTGLFWSGSRPPDRQVGAGGGSASTMGERAMGRTTVKARRAALPGPPRSAAAMMAPSANTSRAWPMKVHETWIAIRGWSVTDRMASLSVQLPWWML